MRWTNVYNENYNNSGGNISFTRAFTRSTLNSTSVLEGNGFASFLLGAPSSGNVDVNPMPHYEWFYVAPWIQDDWKVSNRLTLNLGFRWDFNGSVKEADNMLNYVFDPTIVNPVSARVGQQVMGGLTFVGVDGAPDRPWKYGQEQLPGAHRRGLLAQREDRVARRLGQVLPQPDRSGLQQRVQSDVTNLIASNDGNRTPTYALSNPWPNGIQAAARQLSWAARPSSGGVRAFRTLTSSCRTSTSSRSASSASCRGGSRST